MCNHFPTLVFTVIHTARLFCPETVPDQDYTFSLIKSPKSECSYWSGEQNCACVLLFSAIKTTTTKNNTTSAKYNTAFSYFWTLSLICYCENDFKPFFPLPTPLFSTLPFSLASIYLGQQPQYLTPVLLKFVLTVSKFVFCFVFLLLFFVAVVIMSCLFLFCNIRIYFELFARHSFMCCCCCFQHKCIWVQFI